MMPKPAPSSYQADKSHIGVVRFSVAAGLGLTII